MASIDKILNNVEPIIINTINLLASEGSKEQLKDWLKECNVEIKRLEEEKQNAYYLYLEKAYLEYILN